MEMKAGLTSSVVLHVALIGFGLVSLSSPRTLDMAYSEALPVEIVPFSSISQIQQGDKKAPKAEKAAPLPTTRPDTVENAQKIGDNSEDTDKTPTPEAKQKPVETAEAPAPAPDPVAQPVEKNEPEPVKQPEAIQVPATELTPQPQPRQEVKPDPTPETAVSEAANAESVALPDHVPSPQARPQPPQAQTAKAPDRKDADKPNVTQAARPKSDEKESNIYDEVAALLNKEKAAGGGAKRSTEQAAFGGKKTTGGASLTQSEMDALRGQIERCWSIPAGAADAEMLIISIRFNLTQAGLVDGRPEIVSGGATSGVQRSTAESALRAVERCAPYKLPSEKYESWAEVTVNFNLSEMF